MGASANTLRQALFALKNAHKRAGRGDPTEKMHRVWILASAMDRRAVQKPRRLGVTPEMLQWLGRKVLDPLQERHGDPAYADGAMVMAAMLVGWFFMLRAKEFADSNGIDEDMVTRGRDLRFSSEFGNNGLPETVTLQFRKTKVDQLAFGDSKTLQATGKNHLCPVQALWRMKQVWPARFNAGHAESGKPLFRWSSGRVLKRLEIQHLLQQAACGVGLPPERFLSHSLRIGGATALFQATADVELVKRMGRWSSSAVQRYLHDGGTVEKVSQRMAELQSRPHYT